jgi:hypothetical protein
MPYTCSANQKAQSLAAPSMSSNSSAWWRRWRDTGPPNRVQPLTDIADYGSQNVLSTFDAYRFFWSAQRVNAPGYADQNWFQLSRQYFSQVFLAINTLNRHFYQAEAEFYELDPREPDRRIPVYPKDEVVEFLSHPNPKETLADILEQGNLQKCLTGMAPIWTPWELDIEWDRPQEAYVLSTASLIPQPISPLWPNGAWLVQPWLPAGPYAQIPVQQGVGTVVPAEQIVMVKDPHPFFRWTGYACLFAIAAQTDVVRQMDLSRANEMKQGLKQRFMLSFDSLAFQPSAKDMERLREQLVNIYGGAENSGIPFVAPPFSKLTPFTNSPAEMGWEKSWDQLLEFTLAAFGLNKAIAGLSGHDNFATDHASIMSFHYSSLDPMLAKFASALTVGLIHPWYSEDVHLHLHGKKPSDEKFDLERANAAASKPGVITVGEFRQLVGLKPSDRDKEWIGGTGQQPGTGGGAMVPSDPMTAALGQGDKEAAQVGPADLGLKSHTKKAWTDGETIEEVLEILKRRGRAKEVHANGRVSATANGK